VSIEDDRVFLPMKGAALQARRYLRYLLSRYEVDYGAFARPVCPKRTIFLTGILFIIVSESLAAQREHECNIYLA